MMLTCAWKNFLDGNFQLKHIISRNIHPRFTLQASGGRARATNSLVLYLSGSAEITAGGAALIIRPGNLVYYPAGSYYRSVVDIENTDYDMVDFTILNDAGEESALGSQPTVLFTACPATYRLKLAEMVRVNQFGGLASNLKSNALLYDLFYNLVLDKFMEASRLSGYQRILPAILHLEQHYVDNLTVAQLAELSNMSLTGFRKMFNKYSGLSPLEYRNNLRIRRACDLLRAGGHNVTEVAELTGFGNAFYFSRAFRKVTGKTPSEIMRSE